MRIAQVVPIWERVPPPHYGGTQRVAYEVTEGLVRRGHDVTLFATGDSQTSAELISVYPRALYRDGISWENHLYPALNILAAFKHASEFDIIHCHIDRHTEYLALSLARFAPVPVVFTVHFIVPETAEREDRRRFLVEHSELNYISISNAQRRAIPPVNFIATVYNGINLEELQFNAQPGEYLVWLGRITKAKGTKEAIEIARQTDRTLILAGKLDRLNPIDLDYYQREVEPYIDGDKVRFIGEVDGFAKNKLFKEAYALLNPIQWEEPFGLVPVEAMAAGVPVIAFRRGSMPEVVADRQSGFVVDTIPEALEAYRRISEIDRFECRRHVAENFTCDKMVAGYEAVYNTIAGKR